MKKKILFLPVLVLIALVSWSQNKTTGVPLIGSKAPSFTAESTEGLIRFPDDFGKNWKILFSHPRDFTPVCTSEVMELARMQEEFEALGVKIAVVSSDDVAQHNKWKKSIEDFFAENNEKLQINFPFIDDHMTAVSDLYGMIHEKTRDVRYVRGVFIINPENIIEAITFYPMKVGRNMDEVKRSVEALQTVNSHLSAPVNWRPGEDLLLPASPYLIPGNENQTGLNELYYQKGNLLWYKKNHQSGSL
jgi:peroxiredoxin (alkyl hydroperoxide reductase subunit C)